jgi:hypothetical protein
MKKTMTAAMVLMFVLVGCSAFAGPPRDEVVGMMPEAGAMPATPASPSLPTDGGRAELDGGSVQTDSGLIEMPREIDGGVAVDQPLPGEGCDPDRDRDLEPPPCRLDGCDRAYLICTHASIWRCAPEAGAICVPVPATDAGTDAGRAELDAGSPTVDAGCDAGPIARDAGTRDAGTDAGRAELDAGPAAMATDAGPGDYCVPGSFVGCWLACGLIGHIDCNTTNGRYDTACSPFAGLECPTATRDAGTPDAGTRDAGSYAGSDAGRDMGTDAGPPPVVDAGSDAGPAPTPDAGLSYTPTDFARIRIGAATTVAEVLAWCPDGGVPDIRLHNGRVWRTSRRGTTLDIPMTELVPGPYNSTVFCQLDIVDPTAASPEPSWNGYASPIVATATLGTPVSTTRFVEVSIGGRPALARTFNCQDTWTRGIRRVQVQVVDPSIALPSSCSGATGTP